MNGISSSPSLAVGPRDRPSSYSPSLVFLGEHGRFAEGAADGVEGGRGPSGLPCRCCRGGAFFLSLSLWGSPVECGPTGGWWLLVDREPKKQGCPLKRDPRFAPGPIDAWAHMLAIPAADLTSLRPQSELERVLFVPTVVRLQRQEASSVSRLHPGPGRTPSLPTEPRQARYDPMWAREWLPRGWERGRRARTDFFVFQGCRSGGLGSDSIGFIPSRDTRRCVGPRA